MVATLRTAPRRRFRFIAALVLLLTPSIALAARFLAKDFETTYLPRARTVAIVPLQNMSNTPEGAQAGQSIREAIFYELNRQRHKYTVTIQDIAETDKLLRGASLTDSMAAQLPARDLCSLLGVSAIMKGSVTGFSKKGTGGQIATALLFGAAKGSEVKTDVAMYDSTDGQLVWQHNIEKVGGLMSSPDALRNKVGGTVAGKFPYRPKD